MNASMTHLQVTLLGTPVVPGVARFGDATAAGSLASQAYLITPCFFSRVSSTGLSGFLAATATAMPSSANNLAQLAPNAIAVFAESNPLGAEILRTNLASLLDLLDRVRVP